MAGPEQLRVVLVHDWLTGMRGGERCLEVLCRRWPRAKLFSLLHRRGAVSADIERLEPRGSFLDTLPEVHRYYRYLLPVMPLAARWRIPSCDVVISLSHCVAKAALSPRGVPHLCYCFTPMRYVWDLRRAYFGDERGMLGRLRGAFLDWLREWDRSTAQRVTHFVAISRTVQKRIRDCYGRESVVVYPPVNTDFFTPADFPREDYFLVVSALVAYKRIDLAIVSCNALRRPLVIIGSGPEEARLRALAGPTIHFLGHQADEAVRDHMRRARALLFPGEEDFGLVPVEAMACGTPVIALGRGGAAGTVVPLQHAEDPTGIWFSEQSAEELATALELFERYRGDFSPSTARRQALRFTRDRFEHEFLAHVNHARAARRSATWPLRADSSGLMKAPDPPRQVVL